MNKTKKLEEYFYDLRFKDEHHLGLGNIRLTIAQQDEIVCMVLNLLEGEGKMDIFCRILKKIANHIQENDREATNIYLGEEDFAELQNYVNNNFGVGIASKVVARWFNGAEVIKVDLQRHINVC